MKYKLEMELTVKKTIYIDDKFYDFPIGADKKDFIEKTERTQLEMDAVGYINDVVLSDQPDMKFKVKAKKVKK